MQYTDCPISQEGNQAITFGQLIEHNIRNIFVEKSYKKCGGETILRPFSKKLKFIAEVGTKLQKIHFLENLRTITQEGNM